MEQYACLRNSFKCQLQTLLKDKSVAMFIQLPSKINNNLLTLLSVILYLVIRIADNPLKELSVPISGAINSHLQTSRE